MILGSISRFLQLDNDRRWSPFRCSIEGGSSLIADPCNSRDSKNSMVSKISGKVSSLEQLSRSRVRRDFNLQMPVGIFLSLVHSDRYNSVRLVRLWTDEGTSSIAVPIKFNLSILAEVSGNFVTLLQPPRDKFRSLFSCWTEEGNSTKIQQPVRSTSSSERKSVRFGILMRRGQYLRISHFNFGACCKKKKKKNLLKWLE